MSFPETEKGTGVDARAYLGKSGGFFLVERLHRARFVVSDVEDGI